MRVRPTGRYRRTLTPIPAPPYRDRGQRRGMAFAILLTLVLGALWHRPASAQQTAPFYCNSNAIYSASTSGTTKVISAPQTGPTWICGYTMQSAAAVSLSLEYGTAGTTCGSGTQALTPTYAFNTTPSSVTDSSPAFRGLYVPPGNDVCVLSSAAAAGAAQVFFYQQR